MKQLIKYWGYFLLLGVSVFDFAKVDSDYLLNNSALIKEIKLSEYYQLDYIDPTYNRNSFKNTKKKYSRINRFDFGVDIVTLTCKQLIDQLVASYNEVATRSVDSGFVREAVKANHYIGTAIKGVSGCNYDFEAMTGGNILEIDIFQSKNNFIDFAKWLISKYGTPDEIQIYQLNLNDIQLIWKGYPNSDYKYIELATHSVFTPKFTVKGLTYRFLIVGSRIDRRPLN